MRSDFTESSLIVRLFISIFAIVFATSCSTSVGQEPSLEIGGIELATRKASEQMVIFVTPDDEEFICLAPAPDVGRSFDESFSLGSKLGEEGGTHTESLGGRTGLALITRELFYRSCEFSRNYKLSKDEALSLYLKQLDLLKSFGGYLAEEDEASDDDSDN